jgi:3-oxoisoapionate decarboxylase
MRDRDAMSRNHELAFSRREFVQAVTAVAALPLLPATRGSMGIVYTSFAVRMLHGRDIMKTTAAALPADGFIDLCHRFGASGCQIDMSQLRSTDPAYLGSLRESLDEKALFAELSISARTLEDADAFDGMTRVARQLGVTRLRVALLYGRRYETFTTMEQWRSFSQRWRDTLLRMRAAFDRAGLLIGIENHKDWLAPELADLLQAIDSPHVGVCVDFGNNLALLEDPMATVEALAPYVITTHVKDMAVRAYDRGFELSEVPLGAGCLPLAEMIAALRQVRPDVHLCLEMITRDPLNVPYLDDQYWVTYETRDPERVERFRASILSRAWTDPLPRTTGLAPDEQIAAEDENVRRSMAHGRNVLTL